MAPGAERQLERELGPVGAQPLHLDGRADQPALAGGQEARHPRAVGVAVALGHQLGQRRGRRSRPRVLPNIASAPAFQKMIRPLAVGGHDRRRASRR